jgi:hypothetical protein
MALFAILAPLDNAKIGEAIEQAFPSEFFSVSNGQWFVSGTGTPKEISDRIGITDGKNGAGIVVAVSSYWGRSSPDLWPWLSARLSK